MIRLKNLLLYDSSRFIHLAIAAVLYVLSRQYYFAGLLLVFEIIYLFKTSKNMVIYALIIFGIISFRFSHLDNQVIPKEGTIIGVEDNRLEIINKGKHYLYLDNAFLYEVGMVIHFSGERIERDYTNIPNSFDYELYLKSQNIRSEIYVDSIRVSESKFIWQMIPLKIRLFFASKFSEESAMFLNLFILGEKSDITTDFQEKTSKIGVSHLFAVSGMHLGIIIAILSFFLDRLFIKKRTHRIIISGCLLTYNIITSFTVSIVRASLLVIGVFLTDGVMFSKTDILAFIMIGFLLYNPFFLYGTGFVLSFMVAFSIVLGKKLWVSENKASQIFRIGVLANIVSLPIIVSLNNSFGLLNPIYNVIFVVYVSNLFLPASFLLVLLPSFERIYLMITSGFKILLDIGYQANYYFSFNFVSGFTKMLYWLVLVFCLANYQKIRKIYLIVILLLVSLVNVYWKYLPNISYVRILDVNQGDAIHIHQGSCDILIDTGKPDDFDSVINYFIKQNIKSLDYLIITHFHDDHYGEMLDILNSLDVNNLLVNQEINSKDILKYKIGKEGDLINCGELKMQIINSYSSQNENNNSLVIYLEISHHNWLFTGDIESLIEQRLINEYAFDLDVLKVAHHGSDTSTTLEFLEKFKPEKAVISVGKNQYNHPSKEVVDRLEKTNISVYRTDLLGTITFYYENITTSVVVSSWVYQEKQKFMT